MIRNASIDDSAAISDIYNHYVLNTIVTFEEETVSPIQMVKRLLDVQSRHPWLVYELEGKVVGYAYANAWKPRSAYRHTVESSMYLDPEYTGRGIGKILYSELIKRLEALNIHCMIGGIALPNEISIRLHESMGFKKTGQLTEVGMKFGKWIDVGYWNLLLATRQVHESASHNEEVRRHAEYYY